MGNFCCMIFGYLFKICLTRMFALKAFINNLTKFAWKLIEEKKIRRLMLQNCPSKYHRRTNWAVNSRKVFRFQMIRNYITQNLCAVTISHTHTHKHTKRQIEDEKKGISSRNSLVLLLLFRSFLAEQKAHRSNGASNQFVHSDVANYMLFNRPDKSHKIWAANEMNRTKNGHKEKSQRSIINSIDLNSMMMEQRFDKHNELKWRR